MSSRNDSPFSRSRTASARDGRASARRVPLAIALAAALSGGALALAGHAADTVTVERGFVPAYGLDAHPLVLLAIDERRLTFSALGRDWEIALQPNALLSASARAALVDEELPRFFEGEVLGDEHSWVRLSRTPTSLSGNLFAGGTLYRIEAAGERAAENGAAMAAIDRDYRLVRVGSGVPGELREMARTASRLSPDGSPFAARAMRVGVVVDSRYDERSGGRGLDRALGAMNGVDGLYRDQLGLAVVVDRVRVHDDPDTDPMRTRGGSVEEVLSAFREVRLGDPELPRDLALVHLFSGHDDPDDVIGLGWIDTACRLDGYDLSMSTPFAFDTLLAAHEIAHNLGALHDEDPACHAANGPGPARGVMESRLSDTTLTEFSACSLERLRPSLRSSCLADSLDLTLAVRASSASGNSRRLVGLEVSNNDVERTAPDVRTSTRLPPGTRLVETSAGCRADGEQLVCEHGDILPGATVEASVTVDVAAAESGILVATIVPGEALVDLTPLDNSVSLDLSTDDSAAGVATAQASGTGRADDASDAAGAGRGVPRGGGAAAGEGSGGVGAPEIGALCLSLGFVRGRRRAVRARDERTIRAQRSRSTE